MFGSNAVGAHCQRACQEPTDAASLHSARAQRAVSQPSMATPRRAGPARAWAGWLAPVLLWPAGQALASAPAGMEAPARLWLALLLAGVLLLVAVLLALGWSQRRGGPGAYGGDGPQAPPRLAQAARPEDPPELAGLLVAAAPRMRQPLQALSLYAGTLGQDARPAQRTALQGMEASVRELAGVIDEIDQLLQWLAQAPEVDQGVVPLQGVFAAVSTDLQALAEERGVRVRWSLAGQGQRLVPRASQRLVRALAANAIRSATTRVLVSGRATGAGGVRLRVRDDGPAFAPATPIPLARLLQASPGIERRAPGLGVAAGVAGLMGVRVQACSAHAGANLLDAVLPCAHRAAAPLADASVLSLALLEAEARDGRPNRSRLGQDAAPTGLPASPRSPGRHGGHA